MYLTRNQAWGKPQRGFESHPFRQSRNLANCNAWRVQTRQRWAKMDTAPKAFGVKFEILKKSFRLEKTVKFSAFFPLNSHNQLCASCLRMLMRNGWWTTDKG